MLGQRIKELRQRNGIPPEELAHNAGVSVDTLSRIENNGIERPDTGTLLKIADGLRLKSSSDFVYLMRLNKKQRRFQAYTVGLPKTGTVSMTGIFSNYRAPHEFDQWDTHQMIIKYKKSDILKDELREFIKKRDIMGGIPEMDSAHFNRHYIDILADEFPGAKFICLIRDCYSWLNSYINYFVIPEREAVQCREIGNGMPFDLPRGANEEKEELVRNFPKYIDTPLSFWASSYKKMLKDLPAGRSIIIRTHELSGKIDELAEFIGVPAQTLNREHTHLNKAKYNVSVARDPDYDFLEAKFNEHCSDVMDEFFPGYSLKDFREGRPIPDAEVPLVL